MTNQNYALIGHVHQNAWTTSVGLYNLSSSVVSDDDGNGTTTGYDAFPGFRFVGKLFFDTTVSSFAGSHINFYYYSSGNYDQYATYSGASNTLYSNQMVQSGSYSGGNGYSYIQWGDGAYPSCYGGNGSWNWGSDVTDVDGNTVGAGSPRRGVWTQFVVDAYFQNTNRMPAFKVKSAAATNGFNANTTDTSETSYGGGRYYNGGGGSNNYYSLDNFYLQTSYSFRGDLFAYRIGRGNYVGGS